MVNAQEWLDKKYSPEERNEITFLDISEKNLTGSLKLGGFNNLTELYCFVNQLTELEVSGCLTLTELNCSSNTLPRDLTIFSKLLDCETLILSNNPFIGSLFPLQQLTKLKKICIQNTNLTTGLEYLPKDLEVFYCQGTKLAQELEKLGEPYQNNYISLLKIWQKEFLFWKDKGFTEQWINQWLDTGAKIDDHGFVVWLRDIKKLGLEWIANYKEDYELLSNRFKKYGLCLECNQPNTGEHWCHSCNNPRLKENFTKWTSDSSKVNEFIQKYQLEATDADKFLEWIPYRQFANIEYLAEGGFGKVYKAQWTAGNIHHWDQENKQWQREKDVGADHKEVVLKILNNSQGNTDFLQETANHKIIDDWFNNIVPCYGISQDEECNYLMVMKYMPEGNLRQYLSKNNRELKQLSTILKEKLPREKELKQKIRDLEEQINQEIENLQKQIEIETKEQEQNELEKGEAITSELPKNQKKEGKTKLKELLEAKQKGLDNSEPLQEKRQEFNKLRSEITDLRNKLGLWDKFNQLVNIARGLKDIHQKKLVHHDFHSGNILKGIGKTACLITDLGLCCPAEETSKEKIYGVMSYVAPEIFQNKPYTQASDIYSFGIVAYELLSGLPPYYDKNHDINLALEICQGLRPKFQIQIPLLLENLIKRCWDTNSRNRPTAHELERILRSWEQGDKEFQKQFQEAEKYNENLANEIKYPNYKIHQGAVYHSQLLPTKEITQLMQNLNFQTKTLELNNHLIKAKELAQEITMKQKYHDFKKVLKLVLEKSEELETMITTNQLVISDDLKEALTKIKELKHKSQEKNSIYQELAKKKLAKENELKELKKSVITNNHLEEDDLEDLLEDQDQNIKNTNEKTTKKIERTKKRLAEKITEIEINQLCQLQIEITQLELELNQNIDQSTRQLTRIINNINNVQVGNINFDNAQIGGAVVIGAGQIGDGVDFSLNQTQNWTNIHPNFTPSLTNQWKTNNFTYEQTQEWINIGLTPNDSNFCTWLCDTKHLTAEECLNYHNLNQLKSEYQEQLLQAQIQIPPKTN